MKGIAMALLLAMGVAGCTDNGGGDLDNDGLEDSLETRGWSSQVVEFMDRRVEVQFASDPSKVDTDGDGLTDQEEFFLRTNPSEKDTDDDGLTDCQETRHTNASQCETPGFDSETDGDGGYATDPRKADSDPGPSAYKLQQDWFDETGQGPPQWGDGLSDGEEVLGIWVDTGPRRVLVRSDPRAADTDEDGLEDGEEAHVYGSLAHSADSDGDGCGDATDLWPHRDASPRLGLESLRLINAPSGNSADIRLTTLLFSKVERVPEQPQTVQEGGEWDLTGVDPVLDNSQACNVHVREGWLQLQVLAYDIASETNLDIASGSEVGSGGSVVVWWHPASGALSAERAGPALTTPIVASGAHAEIRFGPAS